jgi:hypothetical protein
MSVCNKEKKWFNHIWICEEKRTEIEELIKETRGKNKLIHRGSGKEYPDNRNRLDTLWDIKYKRN